MSIILHGVPIGGGIAIGRAHLLTQSMDDVVHLALDDDEIPAEQARFDIAVRDTRKQLEMLWGTIPENAPAELGAFLSLHIMLLSDPTISREPRELIESQRCNAEWGLKLQCDTLVEQFDAIEEDYLRERKHDVLQVIERIFKNLGVLLLTDMVGGTPANITWRLVEAGKVEAVAGINLPMLVRALCYSSQALEVVVSKAITGGLEGVYYMLPEGKDAKATD